MDEPEKYYPVPGTTSNKGLIFKPFRFLEIDSATTMPQPYATYRPARIVKTKARWYIEYWYRVPKDLYAGKDWKRYRIFEDINCYKTDEYAELLRDAVNKKLSQGYNPFSEEKHFVAPAVKQVIVSLYAAMKMYLEDCTARGLRFKTFESYQVIVNHLTTYFTPHRRLYDSVTSFSKKDLEDFVSALRKDRGWSNKTVNNYMRILKTLWAFFVKKELVEKNVAGSLEELSTVTSRNKYYSDEIATKIKDSIRKVDPDLYDFIQFIYYTGTRPKSEARLLQVKHILFDRKLLFIPGEISKNKKADYIPMCDDLVELLQSRKGLPEDHFIFGGQKERSHNHYANHYKPFKDKFKLEPAFSIYSWKHTRAIHLAEAGANPYEIMKLFRHQSLEMTMIYLRELGCNISTEINNKTRKF